MHAQSLLSAVAILLALLLLRNWYKVNYRSRMARRSREMLRRRLTDTNLVSRVRPGSLVVANRVIEPGSIGQNVGLMQDSADNGQHTDTSGNGQSVAGVAGSGESADARVAGSVGLADARVADTVGLADVHPRSGSAEIWALRSRLRDRDETIRQLQQALEDIREIRAFSSGVVSGTVSAEADHAPRNPATEMDAGKAGDAEIARLKAMLIEHEHVLRRNAHAQEEVQKLNRLLFEKSREVELLSQSRDRSEKSLEKFREGARRAALLEQQLSMLEQGNRQLEAELVRLRKAQTGSGPASTADEVRKAGQADSSGKLRMLDDLQRSQAEAGVARQNDLELRRLRSELASIRSGKSDAERQINELKRRLREQQQVLEQATSPSNTVGSPDKQLAGTGEPQRTIKALFIAPAEHDDLKKIKGIGPVMERTLNELGVTTFRQLAEFTQRDIDQVSEAIGAFPGRIERDDWVGKARQIVEGRNVSA